jgi:hypothetical protein
MSVLWFRALILFKFSILGQSVFAADFSGANLAGAHLTNADLRGSNLSGADLTNANLSGTNLMDTDITQSQLDSACGFGTKLPAGLEIKPCPASVAAAAEKPDTLIYKFSSPSADEVGRRIMTSAASADAPTAMMPTSTQSPETKISFLEAIQDEATSVIREAPKCTDEGLRGTLVMATPSRSGFPADATTLASSGRTLTTVTTKGENVAEIDSAVDAIANVLNTRATNYLKQLTRDCSF